MSDFDDFTSEALGDAGDIIGRESFTIRGLDGQTFEGILNEFTAVREIDLGGKVGTYTASLVCELEEFDELDGPLERSLEGKRLTIGGREYKIDRVSVDSSSATLGLANLNSK
ncbi:hypothetical protein [Prosthecobacter sp.]|uniref:hypothetical protein n=1 Tax=Prosthecobacter sp. TaxID=1965333 RepID=UPI003785276A